VQSKERFPHSHSLHGGCGIPQSQNNKPTFTQNI
jgi:hypothetical protein